ncbi:MAG TPA: hypothetical protein VH877_09885 [Polyangia bacterium]|nr:hypothetical protein [Polyangia bacterium]
MRLKRYFRGLGALLLVSWMAPRDAGATVVAPLDLRGMVSQADEIALGRVEAQRSRWTADHSAILTEVTLRVERGVKGVRDGERITLLREGGEVDGLGMLVRGAARFEPGEEVLVFLERRDGLPRQAQKATAPSAGPRWTVGMAQGKMRIASVAGRRMAVRNMEGLAFLGRPPEEPAVRPLDELLAEIAALVQAEGGR